MASKTIDIASFFNEAAALLTACSAVAPAQLQVVAEVLITSFEQGGKVLLCGNGGSATQAQHFAAEFVNKLRTYRRALPAVALSADTAALTSIGNDLEFAKIFSRQVEALGRPGDVLWGLSTSGSSRNVIEACRVARQQGLITVCCIGRPGTPLEAAADYPLSVPADDTARIQELHLVYGHCICALVENHYL